MTSTRKMMSDDPWHGIKRPETVDAINALRVPQVGSSTWGLYWAVDVRRQCLLILQHQVSREISQRLPRLRGLLVEEWPTEARVGQRVVIRLTDAEQRDIFHRFCLDVVEATRSAESDKDALARFLKRTWRWHRMLRSGRDGRLTDEEQKGLIGELRLLKTHVLASLTTHDAVEAWTGPTGMPKDFQVGQVCVEAKALSPQKAEVVISSVEQLDTLGASRLFLHVTEVARATAETPSAVTVTSVADRVRNMIDAKDPSAVFAFDERLNAVGFNWEDDYTDKHWVVGKEMLFEVAEGFPRIIPSMVPPSVHDVRYVVALTACERFRVGVDVLTQAFGVAQDAS